MVRPAKGGWRTDVGGLGGGSTFGFGDGGLGFGGETSCGGGGETDGGEMRGCSCGGEMLPFGIGGSLIAFTGGGGFGFGDFGPCGGGGSDIDAISAETLLFTR